jgi:hypothetical protein
MDENHIQKFNFNMENENGELVVKGQITGKTEIPFMDDLKLKAVIALLNSTDKQNFIDTKNGQLFDDYIREVEETISEMKKYNRFQGETNRWS